LRSAAVTKRKNNIASMNHQIIQDNERHIKEQKIKNRELANIENAEIFKKQVDNSIFLYIISRVNFIIFNS